MISSLTRTENAMLAFLLAVVPSACEGYAVPDGYAASEPDLPWLTVAAEKFLAEVPDWPPSRRRDVELYLSDVTAGLIAVKFEPRHIDDVLMVEGVKGVEGRDQPSGFLRDNELNDKIGSLELFGITGAESEKTALLAAWLPTRRQADGSFLPMIYIADVTVKRMGNRWIAVDPPHFRR